MGCAFSSVASLCPKLTNNKPRPKEAVKSNPATPDQTFHQFPRLPYELRRQIWIECLLPEIPRVFALELAIALTDVDNDPNTNRQPADIKFAPAKPVDYGRNELRDLITATDASRRIGSICREARDATAFALPDVLEIKANASWANYSQKPHISMASFRFNAKRDIIGVVSCYSERLKSVHTWTERGHILPNAQIIRHLAVDTSMTEDWRFCDIWLKCGCGKPNCVHCSRDPLLAFLRLFPNLKSFHILQYSTLFLAEERSVEEELEPVGLCDCESGGQGIKHDWPIVKGMPDDSYFVSYTENGGCSYPVLPRLGYDRDLWGGQWPYYDALENLDIRILRRVNLSET